MAEVNHLRFTVAGQDAVTSGGRCRSRWNGERLAGPGLDEQLACDRQFDRVVDNHGHQSRGLQIERSALP